MQAEAPEAVQRLLTAAESDKGKDKDKEPTATEKGSQSVKGKGEKKSANAAPNSLSEQEREDLEALIALAQRRLNGA